MRRVCPRCGTTHRDSVRQCRSASPRVTRRPPEGRLPAMKGWIRNGAVYLATGYVLFFISERIFWSTFRTGDHLGELAVTWLAYSVIACVFVNVVVRFQVTTAATAALAGALYGWLTEGTLVGTLYGTESSAPFPMSLVWTGLSWHALISVLVGWHFLGNALKKPRPWQALGWSLLLGLYWGAWAPFLWRENPPQIASVGDFATHALLCTLPWMLCHALLLRIPTHSVRPGWIGLGFSLLVLAVFYGAQVKTLGLRPLIILPALTGLILGLLAGTRSKRVVPLDTGSGPPRPLLPVLTLLATPVAAVTLYAVQRSLRVDGIAPIHFYNAGGTLAVGVIAWAVYAVTRSPHPPAPSL